VISVSILLYINIFKLYINLYIIRITVDMNKFLQSESTTTSFFFSFLIVDHLKKSIIAHESYNHSDVVGQMQ
jgi:hypothetical protein